MKKLYLLATLIAAVVAAPSALADPVTGNVYANVPSFCQINSVEDVTADFGMGTRSMESTGLISVICNLNKGYSITNTTVDSAGRFVIPAVSGTSGASMQVELRQNVTGSAWTDASILGGTGTGLTQLIPFKLVFNPNGGPIPSYGQYVGTLTFDLWTI